MEQERKINRWDKRRSNKRLKRLKKTEKYKNTVNSLDTLNIRLPELNSRQKNEIEKELIKS
ncbi:MAG: hypothetical protein JW982_07500 [Spirochaetes bacterium]|nr:hypothetical protein [Spirochaetota bacterium]